MWKHRLLLQKLIFDFFYENLKIFDFFYKNLLFFIQKPKTYFLIKTEKFTNFFNLFKKLNNLFQFIISVKKIGFWKCRTLYENFRFF